MYRQIGKVRNLGPATLLFASDFRGNGDPARDCGVGLALAEIKFRPEIARDWNIKYPTNVDWIVTLP